jgi:hypothetical protein
MFTVDISYGNRIYHHIVAWAHAAASATDRRQQCVSVSGRAYGHTQAAPAPRPSAGPRALLYAAPRRRGTFPSPPRVRCYSEHSVGHASGTDGPSGADDGAVAADPPSERTDFQPAERGEEAAGSECGHASHAREGQRVRVSSPGFAFRTQPGRTKRPAADHAAARLYAAKPGRFWIATRRCFAEQPSGQPHFDDGRCYRNKADH